MNVKTLRDDFALVFLSAQVQVDLMMQKLHGMAPSDVGPMLQQAYIAADACLTLREKLTPEESKSAAFRRQIQRPS